MVYSIIVSMYKIFSRAWQFDRGFLLVLLIVLVLLVLLTHGFDSSTRNHGDVIDSPPTKKRWVVLKRDYGTSRFDRSDSETR